MEIPEEITLRHYKPEDYPMLLEWWETHGADQMPQSMIPPSTCIVMLNGEPAASGSVFLCNSNHVAFFHGMVTRPGLQMATAKRVLLALQDGLDIIMKSSGHTLLLGTVQTGPLARGAKMMGFSILSKPMHSVARVIKPNLKTVEQ